jgi:hypothetical protein
MRCHHIWSRWILFPLLISASLTCSAFEVAGYKSGISLEEAETRAAHFGDVAKRMDSVVLINRRNSATNEFDAYILFFCANHLYQLTISHEFKTASFINLLKSYRNQYGSPEVGFTRHSVGDYNQVNEAEFQWRTASDTLTLSVSAPENSESKPNLVDGITQRYVDTTIQCPTK